MSEKTRRWAIYSDRVVLLNDVVQGYVVIEGEQIVAIQDDFEGPVVDHSGLVVMAGLVDSHVHINEPGRTEWEGFFTATQAAMAGGITTVVDMPLNCDPVTTTVSALQVKMDSLGAQLFVDIGFWGGVVPQELDNLEALLQAGVLGCKAFMIHSGIDDFPESDTETLRKAMQLLKKYNLPLLAHAELDCGAHITCSDEREYANYLQSRPQEWEVRAIELLIELTRETGCAVHVVHLSAADAIPMIQAAKDEGLNITVETCPHYLCLTAEEIAQGQTVFKCAPPIRENTNRLSLWEGVKQGTIDFIVSDHSPCTPNLKKFETGNFNDAWGGISSLQLGLPNVWTVGRDFDVSLCDLTQWLSWRPSQFAGLETKKGQIAPGFDADFVVWDPEASFVLEPSDLRFKHKMSPYLGRNLKGRVLYTYLRGTEVYSNGTVQTEPLGRPILNPQNILGHIFNFISGDSHD